MAKKEEIILAFTGNRPDKLPNGYDMSGEKNQFLKHRMELALKRIKPVITVSGFAQGIDLWGVELSIKLNIPFIAAIPFEGQEKIWPAKAQEYYHKLLAKAMKVEYVCEPGFAKWKFQKRNEYMTEISDVLLAVWDGSPGGTANCIKYAEKVKKQIEYIRF